MTTNILEMRGITKTFPGVKALSNVTLAVERGEVHAICGENGAGKSTLMKVLSGVYPHGTYDGDIVFENETVEFRDLTDSEAKGIVIIHQELALSPYLSIAENIFLNNELKGRGGLIDWNKTNFEASKLLARVGLRENPTTKIMDIGVGKQQLVEIAKALSKEVKLLILDEPTAALNDEDSDHLLDLILHLKGQGITSIIISHKLNEIKKVADSVTVIRDGKTIETIAKQDVTEDRIIKDMVGRDLEHRYPDHTPNIGEELLRVEDWTAHHPQDTIARHGRQRQPQRARRRDRRHRGPHGRRAHRVRDEPVRPELRLAASRARCSSAARRSRPAPSPRRSTTASPTPPRTARPTA